MSKSVLPMFSSKSFIVSGFIFIFIFILSLFLYMVLDSVRICHSFIWSYLVFREPLIEETVFFSIVLSCLLVKDKVPVDAWVYLWVFSLVPFVYISVLCQYHSLLIIIVL